MKSLISEFSYGFALTHELVIALGTLSAAPIFPSLIEEGRSGGGYDVKLEAPGIPLFIQFKRSDCLSTGNAREIRAGAPLSTPYYRFEITAKADSEQHQMLIDLDQAPNLVFYAAPMFHRKAEFDTAFVGGRVRQNSFYVRPRTIGSFTDNRPHYLSFDGSRCFVMSKLREVEAFGVSELESLLASHLREEKRPLRATIEIALSEAEAAQAKSRERVRRRERSIDYAESLAFDVVTETSSAISQVERFRQRQEGAIPPAIDAATSDGPERTALRALADIGLREFSAQLYVVQKKKA